MTHHDLLIDSIADYLYHAYQQGRDDELWCDYEAEQKSQEIVQIVEEFQNQSNDVRKLAYKILVDRFNDKYQVLGDKEKNLLREYINNVSDSPKMKIYLKSFINLSAAIFAFIIILIYVI